MMQPVLVRLTIEDKSQLKMEAQKERQSSSEIIRRALKLYFSKLPHQKSGTEVLLEWINKPQPKIKTSLTSTNYKQYLYGSRHKK